MADKNSIEGQWMKLADTTNEEMPLTEDDFDDVVRNFKPETKADHIPVVFGRASGEGPQIAKVIALRRNGSALSGRLAEVDPRFDQLFQAGKLTRRSISYNRTPEEGTSVAKFGFIPPRVYSAGGMQQSPATDKALSALADAHSNGEATFSDRGSTEAIRTIERPMKGSGAETLRFQSNSERLSDLAKQRQRKDKIWFGEALSQVAAENIELTAPGTTINFGGSAPGKGSEAETLRFQSNSERLSDLAKQRQREDKISFGEALSQVATENPELTAPGTTINFGGSAPGKGAICAAHRHSMELNELAKKRQREDKVSFGEALAQVSSEHPDLTA